VLAVGDLMSEMEKMCCISYTITHQPAHIRFLLQQEFLRVQYDILYVRISCILSIYNQYKVDDTVAWLVEALCYKPEGCRFDS
jgi:hypothetical protein